MARLRAPGTHSLGSLGDDESLDSENELWPTRQDTLHDYGAGAPDGASREGAFNISRGGEARCLVKGCSADLSSTTTKAYFRRFRICPHHMRQPSLRVDGIACRWCQQCGKLHQLQEFDGPNRSCRKALASRFRKRRQQQGQKRELAVDSNDHGSSSPHYVSLPDGAAPLNQHQQQHKKKQQQVYRPKGPAVWGAPGFRMAVGPVDPGPVAGAEGPGSLYGHAPGEGRPEAAERPHRSDPDQPPPKRGRGRPRRLMPDIEEARPGDVHIKDEPQQQQQRIPPWGLGLPPWPLSPNEAGLQSGGAASQQQWQGSAPSMTGPLRTGVHTQSATCVSASAGDGTLRMAGADGSTLTTAGGGGALRLLLPAGELGPGPLAVGFGLGPAVTQAQGLDAMDVPLVRQLQTHGQPLLLAGAGTAGALAGATDGHGPLPLLSLGESNAGELSLGASRALLAAGGLEAPRGGHSLLAQPYSLQQRQWEPAELQQEQLDLRLLPPRFDSSTSSVSALGPGCLVSGLTAVADGRLSGGSIGSGIVGCASGGSSSSVRSAMAVAAHEQRPPQQHQQHNHEKQQQQPPVKQLPSPPHTSPLDMLAALAAAEMAGEETHEGEEEDGGMAAGAERERLQPRQPHAAARDGKAKGWQADMQQQQQQQQASGEGSGAAAEAASGFGVDTICGSLQLRPAEREPGVEQQVLDRLRRQGGPGSLATGVQQLLLQGLMQARQGQGDGGRPLQPQREHEALGHWACGPDQGGPLVTLQPGSWRGAAAPRAVGEQVVRMCGLGGGVGGSWAGCQGRVRESAGMAGVYSGAGEDGVLLLRPLSGSPGEPLSTGAGLGNDQQHSGLRRQPEQRQGHRQQEQQQQDEWDAAERWRPRAQGKGPGQHGLIELRQQQPPQQLGEQASTHSTLAGVLCGMSARARVAVLRQLPPHVAAGVLAQLPTHMLADTQAHLQSFEVSKPEVETEAGQPLSEMELRAGLAQPQEQGWPGRWVAHRDAWDGSQGAGGAARLAPRAVGGPLAGQQERPWLGDRVRSCSSEAPSGLQQPQQQRQQQRLLRPGHGVLDLSVAVPCHPLDAAGSWD